MSSRWALQRDEEGRPTAIMETNTDVTEQRHLEEQLRQAQKMEAIGTLAGGIAHDFNNMLAAIIGNTELALDDVRDSEGVRHNLTQIMKAAARARDLVREILAFSRKSEGNRKPLHLIPLVEETFKLLRASMPASIHMDLRVTSTEDVIVANASQIQQVLINLITNSGQAMPDGGRIELALSEALFDAKHAVPDPDMSVGDYLVVTVRDTGSGMSEEVQQRIFDPFFTTKEKGMGTGLGLAVVYGIVKVHEGSIKVTSTPGEGTTFSVYLPKEQAEVKISAEAGSAAEAGSGSILFIDDEQILRKTLEAMLSRLGYKVTTASDAREALALFAKDPQAFDLIITDQTMPGMTGLSMSSEFLRIRPDLPIILCTGYSERVDEASAKAAGITELLMKPLTREELAQAVTKALNRVTRPRMRINI